MSKFTDEERAFLQMGVQEAKRRAEYKKKKKYQYHDWNKWEDSRHIFNILYIPEHMTEKFEGCRIHIPQRRRIHKQIKQNQKNKKAGLVSLFPRAKVWNIQHVDEDPDDPYTVICPVCLRLEETMAKYELAAKSNSKMEAILDKLKQNRAKDRIAFVGVSHTQNENREWEKHLELFEMSYYFWEQSIDFHIFRPRVVDYDDFEEDNWERFQGVDKKVIGAAWRDECDPKYPAPWDMHKGFRIRMKITKTKDSHLFEVEPKGKWPYLPFTIPDVEDSEKEKYEKLLKLAKANQEWIIQQHKDEKIPDLKEDYGPLTFEEQLVKLGEDPEEWKKGQCDDSHLPQDDDDVATLGNKADDITGESRASVSLDDLDDGTTDEELLAGLAEKDPADDDLDSTVEDEDDIPF